MTRRALPPRSTSSGPTPANCRRALVFLVASWLLTCSSAFAAVVDYDIVYVRQARFGNSTNTTWPEVFHPTTLDAGADLMLLHPDGSEELLVAGGAGGVTDPFISFDAQWCHYAFFPTLQKVQMNYVEQQMPAQGSDLYRIHLGTRQIQRLTFQEYEPNTAAGNWYAPDPKNPPNNSYHRGPLIFNLGPCPVPGKKVAFSSNRRGFHPTKGFTAPTLQLFVMDEDGKNVTAIAPMTIGSALHPTPLRDGRLMFSSYESQGLRDARVWGTWVIQPDGRNWGSLVSAFTPDMAFHFMTQLSNGDVIVELYYNLNNNGFGSLYRFPIQPPAGQPAFHSAFPADNPPIDDTLEGGQNYPWKMPFTRRGFYTMTPFTTPSDRAAPPGTNGSRVGKFTHPSAAPNNDLLVVWTPGPANDLNRPIDTPRYDAGLYLIPGGSLITSPTQLVAIKNDPNYNEAWPRAVVPYRAVHGVDEPAQLPWLPNDGSVHAELPAGTPNGLVGTSSFYKRESFPGVVSPYENSFDGLDAFNTTANGQSSNWGFQGADAGKYSNSQIHAVRILAMEPNSYRSDLGYAGRFLFQNHANERLRILGEIPLRKYQTNGTPILDPEGNPDTSFLALIPADTPFTFQTIDRDGLVLNMAQTWHQVRPGEIRADCGGCHAHSQQPLDFALTRAGQPNYQPFDLTRYLTLLSKDTNGQPILKTNAAGAFNVEFVRDIRPILQRSCVPCHTKAAPDPPGRLVFDDLTFYSSSPNTAAVPGDYARLADDPNARWGYPPLVQVGNQPVWRQTQASRYVRMFQSRRSLLVWKIFGRRLDGWANEDHPTESVRGDASTLPPGAHVNEADLDYNGQPMPPPGRAPPLSEDEKITVARWIDLGCPIDVSAATTNTTYVSNRKYSWFLDENRPTLTVSSPRQNLNEGALTEIRVGVADAYTGVSNGTLSVRADVVLNGAAPGTELAGQGSWIAPGIFSIPLSSPLTNLDAGLVTASVMDNQGNETVVQVRFEVQPAGFVHAPVILLQPSDRTIFAGQNATFSVSVHGTEPLSYRWRFDDVDLAGATASILTISHASTNQAGGYSVVITNSAGSVTSTVATLVVNRIPDNTLPTVSIATPAANARLTNPSLTLQGNAHDNLAIERVEARSGADPFQTASGTTNWSALLTLVPGTNVVQVRAVDTAGNESTVLERRFIYVASSPLTLVLNGLGAVSGATNGQRLELGRNYTLTATAGAGHVFSNWTGSFESTSSQLTFLMQNNLALTANFVPNPFLLTKGTYHGLFYERDEVRVPRSGFLTLTLTVQGAFSGRVSAGAQRWPVVGRFGVDGQATNDVVRRGTNAWRIELQLTGANQISGKMRDPLPWEADLVLDRAVFHARTNRAPWAATYTLIIPGWPGDSTLPCGDGFGSVAVDAGGNVRLTGTLADGSKVAQRTALSAQGHWPLFVPIYRGQGTVLSWIQFDSNALTTDLTGDFSWIKPAVPTATLYPAGFTNETAAYGSRWVRPNVTERVLQLTNGMMLFEAGGLPAPFTNYFTLGFGGRLTNASAAPFRFKFTSRSGLFTGSIAEPPSSQIQFRGALNQKRNGGSGHFLGTNQSGHLQIQAAP